MSLDGFPNIFPDTIIENSFLWVYRALLYTFSLRQCFQEVIIYWLISIHIEAALINFLILINSPIPFNFFSKVLCQQYLALDLNEKVKLRLLTSLIFIKSKFFKLISSEIFVINNQYQVHIPVVPKILSQGRFLHDSKDCEFLSPIIQYYFSKEQFISQFFFSYRFQRYCLSIVFN